MNPTATENEQTAVTSDGVRPAVIFVGPDPEGQGGMATVSRLLLESALAERYELHMVVSHRIGSSAARLRVFLQSLVRLRRLVRAQKSPCVVHVHAATRGSMYRKALVVFLAHKHNAKVVLHVHTGMGAIGEFAGELDPWRRRLLARTMRRADVLISASAAASAEMTKNFGMPPATIVNNPVPGQLPSVSTPRPPSETPSVLYLGGFANPFKGGQVLLDALKHPALASASLAVTLAGPGDAPAQAQSAGRWVGWLNDADKRDALREADIVVLPSTSEGLPVALLEAMSYGKAVVATRVGAIPDVMTDGRDGVLVPSEDRQALASAIAELAADPQRRVDLGKNARLRAADFSIDGVVEQLDGIYRRLLGKEATRV